jgi:CysZ protein
MIDAATAALMQMFTPPFRAVLYKTLGVTLALLALVFVLLDKVIVHFIALPYTWANTLLSILTGVGLVVTLAFVVAPTSFVVAGFFFDELAEEVEREAIDHDEFGLNQSKLMEGDRFKNLERDAGGKPASTFPHPALVPVGRAAPIMDTIWLAVKFAFVAMLVNLIALLLLLVPGVNAVAFFGANAYLFGRGYFELSALRYLPLASVRRLRQQNALRLCVAGLFIAGFLLVPILNLLTPLFATAFMVRISREILRPELEALSVQAAR